MQSQQSREVSHGSLNRTIARSVLLIAGLPVALTVVLTAVQKSRVDAQVETEVRKQAQGTLANACQGVYSMCQAQQESLRLELQSNLRLAEDTLKRQGGVHLLPSTVTWKATDQISKGVTTVRCRRWR